MSAAPAWRRLAAYLLDILLIGVVVSAIVVIFTDFDEAVSAYLPEMADPELRQRIWVQWNMLKRLPFLIWLVFSAMCDASPWLGTPGKRVFGLRVVGVNGEQVSGVRAVARNLAKLVSYAPCGLGLLWAVFSKEHRTWHDMLSATRVIRVQ